MNESVVRQARTRPYHHRPKQQAWEDEHAVMVEELWWRSTVEELAEKHAEDLAAEELHKIVSPETVDGQ